MSVPVLVVALTVTIAFAVVVPTGLTAERWYVVVILGVTVIDVPVTTPIPLSRLVELALLTTHERTELWPLVIVDGFATNEVIVGMDCTTVAEHVVVATVDDASVACSVIEYMPGETAIVCTGDVLPFPHKNAIGATPPDEDAVHVMLDAVGTPTHEAVSAEVAFATANDRTNMAPTTEIEVISLFNVIF